MCSLYALRSTVQVTLSPFSEKVEESSGLFSLLAFFFPFPFEWFDTMSFIKVSKTGQENMGCQLVLKWEAK